MYEDENLREMIQQEVKKLEGEDHQCYGDWIVNLAHTLFTRKLTKTNQLSTWFNITMPRVSLEYFRRIGKQLCAMYMQLGERE